MIQILGLRSFTRDGHVQKYDAFFEKEWRAESIEDLFTNLDKYVAKIDAGERWNIFYTLATCGSSKREFKRQHVIAFDIDGMDKAKVNETIAVVLAALQLRFEDTGIVHSGNGLHFLIGLANPITRKEFFRDHKTQYKILCDRINEALASGQLPGKADPSIFEPRRILRLPGTINRKPDKPEVMARVLNPNMAKINFDLEKISGLTTVKQTEQLPESFLKKYPNIDEDAVLEGCSFLKWMKEKPNQVTEPEWYSGLSITGRFNDSGKASHDLSRGHKKYSVEETNHKISQALEASGPRTCESINKLWGRCAECPSFQKVKSPIMIRSQKFIPTQGTGFHRITWKADGTMGVPKPEYSDLARFFESLHPYVCYGASRIVMAWNGKFYRPIDNAEIEAFAQEHFNPEANNNMVREFRELLGRTNLKPLEWFDDSTRGLMNFRNGVLDVKSGEFFQHEPGRGFRYVFPFDFNVEAQSPTYDRMMEKITNGNKPLRQVLEEFAGYALSGDYYRFHKALVLVGDGANGKSTFLNILKNVAGNGNHSSMTMLDIAQSEYNRAMIDGKLFNISEETQVKALADSSMFKRMVGGGVIQVRKIYKDAYEVTNKAKLIMTCNELMSSTDSSHGFHRRLIIAPFTAVFSKNDEDYDVNIDDKLTQELSGIFNHFFFGYQRLIKQGSFTESQVISDTHDEYKSETDSVQKWTSEDLEYLDEAHYDAKFVSIADMYELYRQYSDRQGEKPVTGNTFGKRLKKIIRDYEKRYRLMKVDKKTVRVLRGIDVYEGGGIGHLVSENPVISRSVGAH